MVAAGNGSSRTQIAQPACISSAIAVAASNKSDGVASYTDISSQVAVFAPGGDFSSSTGPILSSVPAAFNAASFGFSCSYTGPAPTTGGSYCFLAGTSMAAPHVAGAFAAIRTACPSATLDQVLNALKSTGTPITDNRSSGTVTKPRIRVDLAVQSLGCGALAPPTLVVSPSGDMNSSGGQGGPFTPAAFGYQLRSTGGSVGFSIAGLPSCLTASATAGIADNTSPTTITFSVNANAAALPPNSYTASVVFTNTTNGLGNIGRIATLQVNSVAEPVTAPTFFGAATTAASRSG